jgi:hypothetical protein
MQLQSTTAIKLGVDELHSIRYVFQKHKGEDTP